MVFRSVDSPSVNDGSVLWDSAEGRRKLEEASQGKLPSFDRSLNDDRVRKLGFSSADSILPAGAADGENARQRDGGRIRSADEAGKQPRLSVEEVDEEGRTRSRVEETDEFLTSETYDEGGNLVTFEQESLVCTDEYPRGYKLSQRYENGTLVHSVEDTGYERTTFDRLSDGTEITVTDCSD